MAEEKQGTVYIVDYVAEFPDRPLEPGEHRFMGHWEGPTKPDGSFDHEDGPGWDDAEEAIKCGRERAPLVSVRIGTTIYSAGDDDFDDEARPRWESRPS